MPHVRSTSYNVTWPAEVLWNLVLKCHDRPNQKPDLQLIHVSPFERADPFCPAGILFVAVLLLTFRTIIITALLYAVNQIWTRWTVNSREG